MSLVFHILPSAYDDDEEEGSQDTVAAKKNATLILFANISAMEDRIFMKFET